MSSAPGPDSQRGPCSTLNHFPIQKEVTIPWGPEPEDAMLIIPKCPSYALQHVILKAKEKKEVGG